MESILGIIINTQLYISLYYIAAWYLNYCSEIWGDTNKSSLKRLYRIIHKVGYLEQTNALFYNQNYHLVYYGTLQILRKSYNNSAADNIQTWFIGTGKFKQYEQQLCQFVD